ncbi:Activator of C kinase protein 1 [Smittium culicis]|uniref:Activator of C kinase protein 1 n=1 Tax=Smittium culicis TaxID=133412 RepID=A0A1R1YSQ1_9FUNG|nr:Activator of C kinase protein 1 [Smittium culicis]
MNPKGEFKKHQLYSGLDISEILKNQEIPGIDINHSKISENMSREKRISPEASPNNSDSGCELGGKNNKGEPVFCIKNSYNVPIDRNTTVTETHQPTKLTKNEVTLLKTQLHESESSKFNLIKGSKDTSKKIKEKISNKSMNETFFVNKITIPEVVYIPLNDTNATNNKKSKKINRAISGVKSAFNLNSSKNKPDKPAQNFVIKKVSKHSFVESFNAEDKPEITNKKNVYNNQTSDTGNESNVVNNSSNLGINDINQAYSKFLTTIPDENAFDSKGNDCNISSIANNIKYTSNNDENCAGKNINDSTYCVDQGRKNSIEDDNSIEELNESEIFPTASVVGNLEAEKCTNLQQEFETMDEDILVSEPTFKKGTVINTSSIDSEENALDIDKTIKDCQYSEKSLNSEVEINEYEFINLSHSFEMASPSLIDFGDGTKGRNPADFIREEHKSESKILISSPSTTGSGESIENEAFLQKKHSQTKSGSIRYSHSMNTTKEQKKKEIETTQINQSGNDLDTQIKGSRRINFKTYNVNDNNYRDSYSASTIRNSVYMSNLLNSPNQLNPRISGYYPGVSNSLASSADTLKIYRQNAEKSKNLETQFLFAKLLIQTVEQLVEQKSQLENFHESSICGISKEPNTDNSIVNKKSVLRFFVSSNKKNRLSREPCYNSSNFESDKKINGIKPHSSIAKIGNKTAKNDSAFDLKYVTSQGTKFNSPKNKSALIIEDKHATYDDHIHGSTLEVDESNLDVGKAKKTSLFSKILNIMKLKKKVKSNVDLDKNIVTNTQVFFDDDNNFGANEPSFDNRNTKINTHTGKISKNDISDPLFDKSPNISIVGQGSSHDTSYESGSRSNNNFRYNIKIDSRTKSTLFSTYTDASGTFCSPEMSKSFVGSPAMNPNSIKETNINELRNEAVYWIKKLDRASVVGATFIYATWLEKGDFGLEKNINRANDYFVTAAKHHHPLANYKVGRFYEQKKIFSRCLAYYNVAASIGDQSANYRLGMSYLVGDLGLSKNYKLSIMHLKRALCEPAKTNVVNRGIKSNGAIVGDRSSYISSNLRYSTFSNTALRQGSSRDSSVIDIRPPKMAFLNSSVSSFVCNKTDIPSQDINNESQLQCAYVLGIVYLGEYPNKDIYQHVFEDFEEAIKLITLAAVNGLSKAQFKLGSCYEFGSYGVQMDKQLCFYYYQLAANKGHKMAQLSLSTLYLTGIDNFLESDDNLAFYWCQQSAAISTGNNTKKRNRKKEFNTEGTFDFEYLDLFNCFDSEYHYAQFGLGHFCEFGIGTDKNEELSMYWYKRAAFNGNIDAIRILKEKKVKAPKKKGFFIKRKAQEIM